MLDRVSQLKSVFFVQLQRACAAAPRRVCIAPLGPVSASLKSGCPLCISNLGEKEENIRLRIARKSSGSSVHNTAETPHVNRLVVWQIHDDLWAAVEATLNVTFYLFFHSFVCSIKNGIERAQMLLIVAASV